MLNEHKLYVFKKLLEYNSFSSVQMGGWMQFLLVVLTVFDATRSYKISRIWPSRDMVNTELTQQLNGTVVLPGDRQYYSLIMQISLGLVRRPGAIALVENRGNKKPKT